jgi:hypothetical protein
LPRKEVITEMRSSLAGTDKSYAVLQVRMKGGRLHVQGRGVAVNRDYGVAVEVDVPLKLATWIDGQHHTEPSLAGTGMKYVPCQVRLRNSVAHFQIPGGEYNRDYGAAFDVEGVGPLTTFLLNEDAVDSDSGAGQLKAVEVED